MLKKLFVAAVAAAAKEIACRLDVQAVVDGAAKGGSGGDSDDPSSTRHDDLRDGAIAGDQGCWGVCGAE